MENKEMMLNRLTELVIEEVKKELNIYQRKVKVGISARHVHVSRDVLDLLFGKGSELSHFKKLSQPGQFAANEKVELIGPKGSIGNVRILGPLRGESQIEISLSDARKLGIKCPVRGSGNLLGTPGIILRGPCGEASLTAGVIVAERHLHMTQQDADKLKLSDGEVVSVKVEGMKGGIMDHVSVRCHPNYELELHIDTDDANAFAINQGQYVTIL